MYILDTNTLIYFFKGLGNVAERLLAVPPKDIGLPAIVEVGIGKSTSPEKRKRQLHQLTDVVTVLAFGRKEATHAAAIRTKLEAKGRPIGPYDILIAATAVANSGVLVTHNTKEFKRIDGLKIEDWY